MDNKKNNVQNLQAFQMFLLRKGIKNTTSATYMYQVKRFLKTHTVDQSDEYIISLIERGNKNRTINFIIKALRNYGQFLEHEKLMTIKFFKVDKNTDKSIFEDGEINDFLSLPPPQFLGGKHIWHYNKMTLFWRCLAYSGARTGEIASLTINDVDFGRDVFLVDGKTGKRNVPMSSSLIEPLKNHINTLKGKYLFPSMRTDRPIERATWDYDFRNRIRRLGIKREKLTPYSLRHSFVTRLLEEDINIFKVQKIVGHKQISTTALYTHLTTKDIVETLKKDPLGRNKLDFNDRFKMFRDSVRKLLDAYCATPDEEKQMLKELTT